MKIHFIPIFETNFQFFVEGSKSLIVIDPGNINPILQHVKATKKPVSHILVTHGHWDHVAALEPLLLAFPKAIVYGLDLQCTTQFMNLQDLDSIRWEGEKISFILTPGHVQNHVIYNFESLKSLFTGDLIFQMGCGRIMDGTFEEQFASLQTLRSLDHENKIYCSHDYSETNWRFVQKNCSPKWTPKLHQMPLSLKTEIIENPFLTPDFLEFQKMRELRNHFF